MKTEDQAQLRELAALAEFEIKRIDESKKESGFTPWLIGATLAGLIWHVLGSASTGLPWQTICGACGCFLLLFDASRSTFRSLAQTPCDRRGGSRIMAANRLFGATRPFLIVYAAKLALAGWLFGQMNILSGISKWVWGSFFLLQLGAVVLILVMSFTDLPLGGSATAVNKFGRLIRWGLELLQLAAIVLLSHSAWNLLTHLETEMLKVVAVLFAIVELFQLLIGHDVPSPLRDSLLQIRRTIGLSEVSPEDAKLRLETALYGLTVSRFFQPQVDALLEALTQATKQQDALIRCIREGGDLLTTAPRNGETLAKIEALFDTMVKLSQDAGGVVDRCELLMAKFRLRVAFISVDLNALTEVQKIQDSIQNQLQLLKDRTVDVSKDIKMFGENWRAYAHVMRAGVQLDPALSPMRSEAGLSK